LAFRFLFLSVVFSESKGSLEGVYFVGWAGLTYLVNHALVELRALFLRFCWAGAVFTIRPCSPEEVESPDFVFLQKKS
jgi:hypothetical protein